MPLRVMVLCTSANVDLNLRLINKEPDGQWKRTLVSSIPDARVKFKYNYLPQSFSTQPGKFLKHSKYRI